MYFVSLSSSPSLSPSPAGVLCLMSDKAESPNVNMTVFEQTAVPISLLLLNPFSLVQPSSEEVNAELRLAKGDSCGWEGCRFKAL